MTGDVNAQINAFIRKLAFRTNVILLCMHVVLLIVFLRLDATIMVVTNVFSVMIYIGMFYVLSKDMVTFLIITYAEVLIHMVLASVTMGWECGFQLYCFAVIPIIYYANYVTRKNGKRRVSIVPLVTVAVVCYYMTIVYNRISEPVYRAVSEKTSDVVYGINSFIVFTFLIVYLYLYGKSELTMEEYLRKMAERDMLTGLANRYSMNKIINRLIKKEKREGIDFTVAILDIDDFKLVNDTYGHTTGDEVLKMVASTIKKCENENVFASRWGGEEFLMVISGKSSYDIAKVMLEVVRVNVESAVVVSGGEEIKITISAGIAVHQKEENIVATVSRADNNLYKAKNSGKNKVIS